jgi:hypothetical protein
MKSKSRCQGCPAEKGQPCGRAQERIRATQIANLKGEDSNKIHQGCPWFVNSAEYNYCFHNMLPDLDGLPLSDKEICKLLMITPSELKEAFNSAIVKLKAPENAEALQEIFDLVSDREHDQDNSLYIPIEFNDSIKAGVHGEIATDDEESNQEGKKGKRGPKPKKKPPLHGMGLPLHHSGNKIDIHYGYSPARASEIQENKKKIRKKADETKE